MKTNTRFLKVDNYIIKTPIIDILNKLRLDLTNGKLRDINESGDNIVVTCPVHAGSKKKKGACNIYIGNDPKIGYGFFRCFVCGSKGSFINFVKECFECSEETAKKWLITNFGKKITSVFSIEDDIILKPKLSASKNYIPLDSSILEKYQNLGDVNCSDHRFTNRKFVDSIINTCLKLQSFYQNNTDYNSIAFDNKQRFLQLYEVYKSYGKLLKKKKPEILEEMRTYLIDIKKEDEKYSKLYEHIHDYQLILKNENTLKEMFSNSYIGIYDSNWVAINVASKNYIY